MEMRNAYRTWVGNQIGKRSLGRPGCRWKDNIEIGLGAIAWCEYGFDSYDAGRDRWRVLVNMVINLWVP
jgi:hypothetical protein